MASAAASRRRRSDRSSATTAPAPVFRERRRRSSGLQARGGRSMAAVFRVDPAEIAEISALPVPYHTTVFDEAEFLRLVAHSYSLTLEEKRDMVAYVPTCAQSAIDALFRIFREEQEK